jgi:hypothetical protein
MISFSKRGQSRIVILSEAKDLLFVASSHHHRGLVPC